MRVKKWESECDSQWRKEAASSISINTIYNKIHYVDDRTIFKPNKQKHIERHAHIKNDNKSNGNKNKN